MNLLQSLNGMLRLEITSAEPTKTIDTLTERGISLYQLEVLNDLTIQLTISRCDYTYVSSFCQKMGNTLRICRKEGVFWYLSELRKRPILLVGFTVLFMMLLFLPTRVLFFQVEGNNLLPTNRILEAAEASGIRFGVSRRSIRSEKMKNALLKELPELSWAGINTFGCRAVISVKEEQQSTTLPSMTGVAGIVASRDGVITSYTATRGNPVCTVGQTVKKNQLLISPYVNCGLSIKAVAAEGEVFAHTNRKIGTVTPYEHQVIQGNGQIQRRYSLIFGKKRINLHKGSGISDATCGRMYAEYYITLPGGFLLPIGLAVETIVSRISSAGKVSQPAAEQMLRSFSKDYVSHQMIAGTILSEKHVIQRMSQIWILDSIYVCSEMIGRTQAERNGEWNE